MNTNITRIGSKETAWWVLTRTLPGTNENVTINLSDTAEDNIVRIVLTN